MGEFNIAPNTQIGKIIVPEKVYENENVYHTDPERYSRSGEFLENMVVDNIIQFCHRWFHLADTLEMIDDIDEFFGSVGLGNYSELINTGYNDEIGRSPFLPTANGIKDVFVKVNSPTRSPFIFHSKRDPKLNYNELSGEINNDR